MKLQKSDFQVKAVKKFVALDGYAISANIYVKNKKAFTVINHGDGGENHYDIAKKDLYDASVAFAKSVGEIQTQYGTLKYDLSLLVEDLLNEHDEAKQLKRWCKKATLFSLPGDEKGRYRTIKHVYDDRVKTHIMQEYPQAIIVNERFV